MVQSPDKKSNRKRTILRRKTGTGHEDREGRTRVSRPSTVVRNLDYLKVNLWLEWEDDSFLSELERLKNIAQVQDVDAVPYHCPGGFDWNVSRTGTKHYTYILTSGDVSLLFNRRHAHGVVPTVRVEIGSVSCWKPGYLYLYERLIKWFRLLGGKVVQEKVSEVHLAADFIGTDINTLDIINDDRWIRKGHKFKIHKDRRNLEGISIGKGDLMLRIYDKVYELKMKSPHKQPVFAEAWGLKRFNETHVTRVEYQLKREILSQFQEKINTVQDLLDSLQSVWKYCTHNWSRFCKSVVNRNHNQTHARNDDFWMMVVKIIWSGVDDIIRSGKTKHKDMDSLRKQMRGLAMTISLFFDVHPEDLDHIIAIAQRVIGDDLTQLYREDEYDFIERMHRKKNELFVNV